MIPSTPLKNSKEVTYSIHKIKSYLSGVKKIYIKRRSNDMIQGEKLCLFKVNSNAETNDSNNRFSLNNAKEKKICIKFKDFVAEEKDNINDKDNLELALAIKKRRYTNNLKKVQKCNNKISLGNDNAKEEINRKKLKISKSMGKVIIGPKDEENTFINKIKRRIFCC